MNLNPIFTLLLTLTFHPWGKYLLLRLLIMNHLANQLIKWLPSLFICCLSCFSRIWIVEGYITWRVFFDLKETTCWVGPFHGGETVQPCFLQQTKLSSSQTACYTIALSGKESRKRCILQHFVFTNCYYNIFSVGKCRATLTNNHRQASELNQECCEIKKYINKQKDAKKL